MAGSRYSLIPKSFWQYLGPAYRGLDADVAALEAAAGSSNIAAELLGSRWVFDGDSITSLGSGLEALRLLSLKSNGRIIGVAETAVPGRSTTQALIDFDIKIAPLAGSVDVIYYEEMTHSISNGLTVIQFLAQLDQYNAKVKAMGARLVVGRDQLPRLAELGMGPLIATRDPGLSYVVSALAVRLLIERRSMGELVELMKDCGRGAPFAQVLERRFGTTVERLDEELASTLKSR